MGIKLTRMHLKYQVPPPFCKCVCDQSCPTPCDPIDCNLPGSSVHGIPRHEYWRGLPFPTPGSIGMLAFKHGFHGPILSSVRWTVLLEGGITNLGISVVSLAKSKMEGRDPNREKCNGTG